MLGVPTSEFLLSNVATWNSACRNSASKPIDICVVVKEEQQIMSIKHDIFLRYIPKKTWTAYSEISMLRHAYIAAESNFHKKKHNVLLKMPPRRI